MKSKIAYRNFEQAFAKLLQRAKRGPTSVHTLLTTLTGKSHVMLVLFLALGGAQIPGIAIFFGLFIGYLGIRLAVGRSFIWLPEWLKHKKIPGGFQTKLLEQILSTLHFMQRWTHPRYEWAINRTSTRVLNGIMIAGIGICLASCPPIPLTGLLATFAVFFIGIGLINSDGVYILLGHVTSVLYFVQVGFIIRYFSFTAIYQWAMDMIGR